MRPDDPLRGHLGMESNHGLARAAADADPVFRRLWEQSGSKMPRAEAWIATEGPNIAAQLLLS